VNAADPAPIGERSESTRGKDASHGIATTIAEVSERASLLVHEEIELAKAEMAEKAAKLARGAAVGVVAGMFLMTALLFFLIGCAWALYYYLPIGTQFTYFYGFFAMAVILVVLGVVAGLIAARVVKKGSPPVPRMAIDEARKIRDSVGPAAAGDGFGPRAAGDAVGRTRSVPVPAEPLAATATPADTGQTQAAYADPGQTTDEHPAVEGGGQY
jgi:Putative Actinobacterial Holin-X, holin superfamily III